MFRITEELRERVRERASGRCECSGPNCRHHRTDARCKNGLRSDDWKVYWHSEKAGEEPSNLEAWCLTCFENNFEVPTHRVTLLRPELADLTALEEADPRRAVTLRSVLRDAGSSLATERGGHVVPGLRDELLIEFEQPEEALAAARELEGRFHEHASKLRLPTVPLSCGIHTGSVRKSRTGDVYGDALSIASMVETLAQAGQIVISDPVAGELGTQVTLEGLGPLPSSEPADDDEPLGCWVVTG